MGVRPHEAVLLHALRGILLDDSGGLVLSVRSVRGGTDAIAVVLDGRRGRLIGAARSCLAHQAGPCCLEGREHRSTSSRRSSGPFYPCRMISSKAGFPPSGSWLYGINEDPISAAAVSPIRAVAPQPA